MSFGAAFASGLGGGLASGGVQLALGPEGLGLFGKKQTPEEPRFQGPGMGSFDDWMKSIYASVPSGTTQSQRIPIEVKPFETPRSDRVQRLMAISNIQAGLGWGR
jgi:hypothetical protein